MEIYQSPGSLLLNSDGLLQYCTEDNKIIEKTSEVKDLGVMMDGDASFEDQIQTMITKARRQAGWILRAFQTRDQLSMSTLFNPLVFFGEKMSFIIYKYVE